MLFSSLKMFFTASIRATASPSSSRSCRLSQPIKIDKEPGRGRGDIQFCCSSLVCLVRQAATPGISTPLFSRLLNCYDDMHMHTDALGKPKHLNIKPTRTQSTPEPFAAEEHGRAAEPGIGWGKEELRPETTDFTDACMSLGFHRFRCDAVQPLSSSFVERQRQQSSKINAHAILLCRYVSYTPESFSDRVWVEPGLPRSCNSPPIYLHLQREQAGRSTTSEAKLKTLWEQRRSVLHKFCAIT